MTEKWELNGLCVRGMRAGKFGTIADCRFSGNEKNAQRISKLPEMEAALKEIAKQDVTEIALDPEWPIRIARTALGVLGYD